MCWRTSTDRAPRTVRPRQSTVVSSTSAARPSGSATSPTTSPDPCSRPAASDLDYTVVWDEPDLIVARAADNCMNSPHEGAIGAFQEYDVVAVPAVDDPG